MSHQADLVSRLTSIRDRSIEARRYVLSDPSNAGRLIDGAESDLEHLAYGPECRSAGRSDALRILLSDCAVDLVCAARCLRAAPEVSAAYLTTVVYELGSLRSEIEKEAGAAIRDEELTEAYKGRG